MINMKLPICTTVPADFYIEREADRQIKKIIDGMGRPGYVLVARQMGKTNLLLHTRELMQTKRVLFTYIDFSLITGLDEDECFNFLIDQTIELHYDILCDAEKEIDELRSKPKYSGHKMFTREICILLKRVDKIVFILDEIDALTRSNYSDRVFSTIRSHYFQRANYPELNKLTYILSGVIEPKDIIKDPNISPFNIGEKIYMNDFTKEEFDSFVNKTTLHDYNSQFLDRLFYWTKGNPRLTWDICQMVESKQVSTTQDLDDLVRSSYLIYYDRAPIDDIRTKVKEDEVLRDAVIQLCFNKGEALPSETKNRLYLAGIIDYEHTKPQFKNPLLEKSLSYEWLNSIIKDPTDFISAADKAIHVDNDYKKAISFLNHFLDDNPTNTNEIDKCNWLLSEAFFRSFNIVDALSCSKKVIDRNPRSKYYLQALLIRAYCYISDKQLFEALHCYDQISSENTVEEDIFVRAQLGKVSVLISLEAKERLNEAEDIVKELLAEQLQETSKTNYLALCSYYIAYIEEIRGNKSKAIGAIDTAINAAQDNERQVLLYKKLSLVEESSKEFVAKDLYKSLDLIESRPSNDSLDNPLILTLYSASQILSTLILDYPQLDIYKHVRRFLYDSKENAVIFMYSILFQNGDEKSSRFFDYIKTLLNKDEWLFDEEQISTIALTDLRENSNYILGDKIVHKWSIDGIHDVSENSLELLSQMILYNLNRRNFTEASFQYELYNSHISEFRNLSEGKRIILDYYNAYILYNTHIQQFRRIAVDVIKRAKSYKEKYANLKTTRLPINEVENIIVQTSEWLTKVTENINSFKATTDSIIDISKLGRNDLIRVQYLDDNRIIDGKVKKYISDIEKGYCEIIKIL